MCSFQVKDCLTKPESHSVHYIGDEMGLIYHTLIEVSMAWLHKSHANMHLICAIFTHNAIGHKVVPVELSAAVFVSVEFFYIGDEVLQLHG